MRAQIVLERAAGGRAARRGSREGGGVLVVGEELEARFFNYRFFGRKQAREFVFRGELFGYDFARLDVGLIEGVDPEDRARDRGRDFPAKEFLSEGVDVRHGDAHHRVSGLFKHGDAGILRRVGDGLQSDVGEDPVITIYIGRSQFFTINRDNAFAEFAGGFCDQLLEPRAQVANSGRGDESNLVAAKFRGCANDQAEHHSRILFYRSGHLAGVDHFFCAREELAGVEAHRRGGNHAEVRERGVASADGRQAVENVAEVVALGDQLHLRARIGDRDKAAARLVFILILIAADGLLHALEEVLLVDVGLEGAAGLAGNYEERFGEVKLFLDTPDLRRVGGVEYVQAREARGLPKGQGEHFRTKA